MLKHSNEILIKLFILFIMFILIQRVQSRPNQFIQIADSFISIGHNLLILIFIDDSVQGVLDMGDLLLRHDLRKNELSYESHGADHFLLMDLFFFFEVRVFFVDCGVESLERELALFDCVGFEDLFRLGSFEGFLGGY